jgi:peptide/nickel transport system substrate-binding protein
VNPTFWLGLPPGAWCEAHGASRPADLLKSDDDYAADHADGTGPFVIASCTAGEDTVFLSNPG